jgi:hypothetical protein
VSVAGVALHLRGEVRDIFFDWLRLHRPDLTQRYEEIYRRGAYATGEERRRLTDLVKGYKGRPKPRRRNETSRGTDPGPEAATVKAPKKAEPQSSLF